MSNLADILQRHLAQKFKGKTVSVPNGANKISERINDLNKQVSQCSCEIVTKDGTFDFDGASMDKINNPFSDNKPMLTSNASLRDCGEPLIWKTLDDSCHLELIL